MAKKVMCGECIWFNGRDLCDLFRTLVKRRKLSHCQAFAGSMEEWDRKKIQVILPGGKTLDSEILEAFKKRRIRVESYEVKPKDDGSTVWSIRGRFR